MPKRSNSRPARLRAVALPVAAAALAGLGVVAVTSGAVFTDSATLGGNTITLGSVVITATETAGLNLDMSDMAPGHTRVAETTVTNTGSLPLVYAVTQSVTAGSTELAQSLVFEAKTGVTTCSTSGFTSSGALLNDVGDTMATGIVFGSPNSGRDFGDRVLAAGASEKLCFRVRLATDAPNSVQGASTTTTLYFRAEQEFGA